MERHLGLSSGQMTVRLLSRIQQLNPCITYLPKIGNKFVSGNIQEILYNALPNYIHTKIIATSSYKWDNNTKLDTEVGTYVDGLLVISAPVQGDKTANRPASNRKYLQW
jgi:hypothetical protein